jgi:hypothetical protein
MTPCDDFQAQFLDHVYGLLEPEETARLGQHVKECGACRAALARAEAQQQLLAAAAKAGFPDVRFEAPAATLPAAGRPALARARLTGFGWGRWAAAAAVLLTVGGASLSANAYWRQHDRVVRARARVAEIQDEIKSLHQEHSERHHRADLAVHTVQEEFERLSSERQTKLVEAHQSIAEQPLHLSVTGPQSVEPGGANEYLVRVYDQANQPVAARVDAMVFDQQHHQYPPTLQGEQPEPGNYRLTLPRDLPVKPGSELSLVVTATGWAAKDKVGPHVTATGKVVLSAPLYQTYLATDKPMYQPGEIVHFQSLTLERFSLKPPPEDLQLVYTVTRPQGDQVEVARGLSRVTGASGEPILGPDKQPVHGVGAGDYALDADAPGGEYTLTVSEAGNRFPPQQRKFLVNRYEKPRLNKELEFTGKSYGPGAEVVAACKVARAEGGTPVADKPVTATAQVDGQPVANLALRTDATGGVSVRFRLPARIERGQGSLAVAFDDDGSVETIVRTIPIVLKKLQVEFFPEGGDLVAGVPNRVYFQARTTLDRPAELQGRVVDERGETVASARTFNDPTQPGANQGMGALDLTPREGHRYELKIESPAGVEGRYPLPDVKPDGVVLRVPTGVTAGQEPIRVVLTSARQDRPLLVGAYCRGRLMAHERVRAAAGQPVTVELRPEGGVGGVYRVTVYEELPAGSDRLNLVPRAERLVYRVPAHRLDLAVHPDKQRYAPGDQVRLHCSATDEQGRPAPAVLMVAVVDKSVLKLADEKTFRSMPTHFLLTTEVRRPEDLEHADFLLGSHASAPVALDLLLGTQGWRRFAEQDPGQFRQKNPQDADRLLVAIGQVSPDTLAPKTTNLDAQALQKVAAAYEPRLAALQERLTTAQHEQAQVVNEEPHFQARLASLNYALAQVNQEQHEAAATLEGYQEKARRVGRALALVLPVIFLVSLALAWLLRRRRDETDASPVRGSRWGPVPFLVGAACSVVLFAVLFPLLSEESVHEQVQTAALATREQAVAPAGRRAMPGLADAPEAEEEKQRVRGLARGEEQAAKLKKDAMDDAPAAGAANKLDLLGRAPAPPAARAMMPQNQAKGMSAPQLGAVPNVYMKRAGQAAPQAIVPQPAQAVPPQAALRELEEMAGQKAKERLPLAVKAQRDARGLPRAAAAVPLLKERQEAAVDRKMAGGLGGVAGRRMAGGGGGRGGFLQVPAAGPAAAFPGQAFGGQAFQFALNVPPPPPLVVREYAHRHSESGGPVRSDFTETLLWQPVLVLPDGKGDATPFQLCDSVTTFQVLAAGHTLDGRLGSVTADLESRLPLTVEPKLPVEVTASDTLQIPVAVANNTDAPRTVSVRVQGTGLNLVAGQAAGRLTLPADGRSRRLYQFQPAVVEGAAELRLDAETPGFADHIVRPLRVVPEGFPITGSRSDLLEKVARQEVVLPETWIKGTLKYQVAVYPSTLADLEKGLEALLREPNGCFEQTSTSNYPNVLILNYLEESGQAKPEVARRARELLDRGYQKLTSFECVDPADRRRRGYEWFGGMAPAHEALTAYGLLQFRDMAHVYPVDQAMVERTRSYLMAHRDGKGGFARNPRALDSFGRAPDNITNAYIVWALTESGKEDDVSRELDALREQAGSSRDPYFLALVANSLINRNRGEEALALLTRLVEAQQKDGHLDAAQTSITGSGGRDLQIETTALTLLGWLKAQRPDRFTDPVRAAVRWIGQQRGGYGGFGSTQSTILALKALIAYARQNKRTAEEGDLILSVGEKEVARQHFPAGAQDAVTLTLDDPEKWLKPGTNALRVEITGRSVFPYTAAWSYRALKPASAVQCPVRLTTQLDRRTAGEGDTVRLTATVENRSGKGQGMTVAIIGLPAGLTLPEDLKQLKDLARLRNDGTEPGPISAWEIRGRELVLYWRDLAPGKRIEVSLDLVCRIPGRYRGPASRAYLYYNADHKDWVEPLEVVIAPKGTE